MKPAEIIDRLRSEGNYVSVEHLRLTSGGHRLPMYKIREERERVHETYMGWVRFSLEPTGGETVVRITTPDGVDVVGSAECSIEDNFNKKVGLQIALGRALQALEAV